MVDLDTRPESILTNVQNIDFQTTILSRFDMIFIVRDEHNETRDRVRFFGVTANLLLFSHC